MNISPDIRHQQLIQIRLIHVPNEQHKPLRSRQMIPHTNTLINRMNLPHPTLSLRSTIKTRSESEDIITNIPIKPRIRIPRHDPRRDRHLPPIQRPRRPAQDTISRSPLDRRRRHGRDLQFMGR